MPPFTEYTATRWYRSPEMLTEKGRYNAPIDIFALGSIMAELYLFRPLFQGDNELDQLRKIQEVLSEEMVQRPFCMQ